MIVQIEKDINGSRLEQLQSQIAQLGYKATHVVTQSGSYLVAIGKEEIDIRKVGKLEGVLDVHRVSDPYKLVSSKWKVGKSKLKVGDDLVIGPHELSIVLGPCSIESENQIANSIAHLKKNNLRIMRGGVFKPRTSPYSFRGVGLEGLQLWSKLAKASNIKIITEVVSTDQIEQIYPYVDIYQVGARNAQNFSLLHELGKVDKPVLLKRGMSETLEELLQAAEYIFSNGNEKLILCERGIRSFEKSYRNTLDLNAVPVLKDKTHLPIFVDPSHAIGIRRYVEPIALAAVVAGADGLLVEVHHNPEKALSDADQTLSFEQADKLVAQARKLFLLRKEEGIL